MSADNGIYIGRFPVGDSFEYRVIHAQAIDNCDYGTEEEQDFARADYYGEAKAFSDEDAAVLYAFQLTKEYPVLEYGVSTIEYNRPLVHKTRAEIDAYWRSK